jgi:hypothetical protein
MGCLDAGWPDPTPHGRSIADQGEGGIKMRVEKLAVDKVWTLSTPPFGRTNTR